MKKVLTLVGAFLRRPETAKELVSALLLAGVMVVVNYFFLSEETFIRFEPDTTLRLVKYIGLYGIAFGGAYLLQAILNPKDASLRNPRLWGLIGFAVLLFALRSWFYQYQSWVDAHVPPAYYTVVYKYFINGAGFMFVFVPCTLFWLLDDRKYQPLYGFHAKGVNLKLYFGLLALMLPLLLWAAQQPDFQATYPRSQRLNLPTGGPHNTLLTAFYEAVYSFDFVVTEFFFRGFLILAFSRYVGAKAVLPMCVFYVSIHFGKPMAEAISSFFGGLLLGILAYETRSIYGGVIVHLGIALLMEILGGVF